MRYQIVVLAAGKGTRMGEVDLPKVLTPLKDRPLISYLLDELKKLKVAIAPVIVVGYKSEVTQKILGSNYHYALQKELLGTADAVKAAKDLVRAENLLILYGDVPFIKSSSITNLVKQHLKSNSILTMFTTKVAHFENAYSPFKRFGRVIRDSADNIIKIVEFQDATPEEKEILELNPGIYLFKSDWLWKNIDTIQQKNKLNEYYLTDLIKVISDQGYQISSSVIDPFEVYGVNTPEDLKIVEKLFLAEY